MKYKSSSRSQKQKSRRRKSHSSTKRRSHKRSHSRSQRGGSTLILSPSVLSNSSNSHFGGKGFTDPHGAVTGCTGPPNSAAALKGADIFTTIGGIKTPVMKGGRRRSCNKRKCNHKYHRMQRGGSHTMNTNGYSIGGVHLKPDLVGIANNLHKAYDSCRG